MLAIPNSLARARVAFIALVLGGILAAAADEADRSFQLFQTQKQRFEAEPTNPTNAWLYAKACFDWAEFCTNRAPRADLAEQGIAAARHAVAARPNNAFPHYYLGLNLGQLARTRSVGALPLVQEMERSFKRAIELDETIDFAGPHRVLGTLYRRAPTWPLSVGSRSKAKRHLARASQLAPQYPENRLTWLECLVEFGELRTAESEFQPLRREWPPAPDISPIPDWQDRWTDWNTRRDQLRARLDPPRPSGTARP